MLVLAAPVNLMCAVHTSITHVHRLFHCLALSDHLFVDAIVRHVMMSSALTRMAHHSYVACTPSAHNPLLSTYLGPGRVWQDQARARARARVCVCVCVCVKCQCSIVVAAIQKVILSFANVLLP